MDIINITETPIVDESLEKYEYREHLPQDLSKYKYDW